MHYMRGHAFSAVHRTHCIGEHFPDHRMAGGRPPARRRLSLVCAHTYIFSYYGSGRRGGCVVLLLVSALSKSCFEISLIALCRTLCVFVHSHTRCMRVHITAYNGARCRCCRCVAVGLLNVSLWGRLRDWSAAAVCLCYWHPQGTRICLYFSAPSRSLYCIRSSCAGPVHV